MFEKRENNINTCIVGDWHWKKPRASLYTTGHNFSGGTLFDTNIKHKNYIWCVLYRFLIIYDLLNGILWSILLHIC